MSHFFEEGKGMFVRTPSWHQLENAVLEESPSTWAEARDAAKMTWDVQTTGVKVEHPYWMSHVEGGNDMVRSVVPAEDYQAIWRDDNHALLAIQPTSYKVITIEQIGEVIEQFFGNDEVTYEALFSLYGGKQIWSVLYFNEPLDIPGDNSKTYTFLGISSRFDGQGGLRVLPSNIRMQCANTVSAAEATDGKHVGMTLRHTANWGERVAEVGNVLRTARTSGEEWAALARELSGRQVTGRGTDRFLNAFMPLATDMNDRQIEWTNRQRDKIISYYESPTCEHIKGTAYGLAQAGLEYADHGRNVKTESGYVNRQLSAREPIKMRAIRSAKLVAGIRL